MIYGYIDESGALGVAMHSNDWFLASVVLFDSECARDKATAKIEDLRKKLRLPEDYEFHCSSNSLKPQREFVKLLSKMEFRFITVAVRKNSSKKTASYKVLADLLTNEIMKVTEEVKLEVDNNPVFYAEIRKSVKGCGLKTVRTRQRNSKHSRLIQVADYVINISSKKVKTKNNKWYKYISDKSVAFVKIVS